MEGSKRKQAVLLFKKMYGFKIGWFLSSIIFSFLGMVKEELVIIYRSELY